MAKYFDQCIDDEFWGEKVGKKPKVNLLKKLLVTVISNPELQFQILDYCFVGDLT